MCVVCGDGRDEWRVLSGQGLRVELGFEDGADASVAAGVQRQGAATGGFHALVSVIAAPDASCRGKRDTPARDAVCAAGCRLPPGCTADRWCEPQFDETARCPRQMLLVRFGAVGWIGSKAMAGAAARMSGDAAALVEDLHGAGRQAHLHLLLGKGVTGPSSNASRPGRGSRC